MKFSQIRSMDVSNGEGVGVALFVQGCPHRCKNCFNPETWDFNGGKEWTEEVKNEFLKLIDRPYIKRVSLLGGSPLADQNLDGILSLVKEIKMRFPDKKIWLYTGYIIDMYELYEADHTEIVVKPRSNNIENDLKRANIVSKCDVLVDGRFEDDKKDLSLPYRGSSNQRLIDCKKSLEKGEIVLWNN